MARLYDKRFKLGFILTLGVFVAANFLSFWQAYNAHQHALERLKTDVMGFHVAFPNWGFPFYWFGYDSLMFEDGSVGLVANFVAAFFSSFVIGFLFRAIPNLWVSR